MGLLDPSSISSALGPPDLTPPHPLLQEGWAPDPYLMDTSQRPGGVAGRSGQASERRGHRTRAQKDPKELARSGAVSRQQERTLTADIFLLGNTSDVDGSFAGSDDLVLIHPSSRCPPAMLGA